MSRKTITLLTLSAMLAATASAGEIKVHVWPTYFRPLEILAVPVLMDTGYWVRIRDPGPIRLRQRDINTYTGCVNLQVECNFNLQMWCRLTPTGAVPGNYSWTMDPAEVRMPGAPPSPMPKVCVTLRNADLRIMPAGARDVQVATVVVSVAPLY
jgi:hypothetical protein